MNTATVNCIVTDVFAECEDFVKESAVLSEKAETKRRTEAAAKAKATRAANAKPKPPKVKEEKAPEPEAVKEPSRCWIGPGQGFLTIKKGKWLKE
jgi:hypothetical protein